MPLTGNPNAPFSNSVRAIETTDPVHPDSINPQLQALINNDAGLNARLGVLEGAGLTALPARVGALEGLNAANRLNALEGLNAGSRLTSLENRMSSAEQALDGIQSNIGVPIGGIIQWAGSIAAPPAGFLLCDGRELPRADYPTLFAKIGTAFGAGGPDTFRIPDLRDRFVMGAGNASLGEVGGANQQALSVANLPAHVHTGATKAPSGTKPQRGQWDADAGAHGHYLVGSTGGGGSGYYGPQIFQMDSMNEFAGGPGFSGISAPLDASNQWSSVPAGAVLGYSVIPNGSEHRHTFTTDPTGSGQPLDNRPAYVALAYIIRAK
ncbi:phage tail protein [Meiothermus sp. Pnk-1]|uniref:phage tail protein n=1 Tax=Meiothermus sp. Pnk-1 TaxID=873128 RepID=UPI000D7BF141|nr:tail fiber protein [Meiothermus sp. Pnk-1]PZA08286.1 hypothetical protein DNA98_03885 [Meiothermus sp. Pnk-1]